MCIERGQPLPDALLNAPDLLQGLDFFYNAFGQLSTCRPVGMGLGSIPWTAIDRYAERNDVEDFDEFLYMVRKMDDAYIEYHLEKSKTATPPKRKP